ncbi:MAG: ABC transporter permease subunit [Gemmatimonadales bacterium]
MISMPTVARRGLLPILLLSAFMPLAILMLVSVGRDWFFPALLPGTIDLTGWRTVLGSGARLRPALIASGVLAVATGVAAMVFGAFAGSAIASARGWRRVVGAGAAFLPVAAPPVAVATGLHATLLGAGLGSSIVGVFIAHLVPACGYTTLYFLGVFTVREGGFEDAARTLGAGVLDVIRRVTIPMMRRELLEAVLLGAIVSWGQVALTLVAGGGRVRTLPLEVMDYLMAGQDQLAATGSLLLAIPPLIAFGVLRLALRNVEMVLP